MIQVVLDTNVIVSALRSNRGASFKLLEMIGQSQRFGINLSVPLVLEYQSVLGRQRTQLSLTLTDIGDLIDYLCSVARLHEIYFLWRPVLSDPNDEFLLELAVRAECDMIITHNVKDFAACEQFGIAAVTPGEFLKIIETRR